MRIKAKHRVKKAVKRKASKPKRKNEVPEDDKEYIIVYDDGVDTEVLARGVSLESARKCIKDKTEEEANAIIGGKPKDDIDGDNFIVYEIVKRVEVDIDWTPNVSFS